MLEPTLYATQPEGRAALERIVAEFGGAFVVVPNRTYHEREAELLELLDEHGLTCGRSLFHPDRPVVERSGLIALAGALEAAQRGTIAPGSRVLVCFTGGCGPDLETPVSPEITLKAGEPVERFWAAVERYIGEATLESDGTAEKGTDPFCRNGGHRPKGGPGASHKRGLSPFPPTSG